MFSERTGPRISVVLLVRNLVGTVASALDSVVTTQPPVEIIVLDGGSDDGTVDVIRQYESRITYWRSRIDGGGGRVVNEGIERATGDVICLLAGDDWLEPGALYRVRAAFSEDPEVEVLSCGTRIVTQKTDGMLRDVGVYRSEEDLAFTVAKLTRHPLTHARVVLRRVYQELGGYRNRYDVADDLDFLLRVCLARRRVKVLTDVIYTYVAHDNSVTFSRSRASALRMARQNRTLAEDYLQRRDLNAEDRKALIDLHGRASARLAFWTLFEEGPLVTATTIRSALRVNPGWLVRIPEWLVANWWRRRRNSKMAGLQKRN